jgi:uncharacterized protein (TIGR00730 family)
MPNGCVTVFGSSRVNPHESAYRDAVRLGQLLAKAGYTLCTGGYTGVMEAVSRGAVEAGGHAIGVTVTSWAARVRSNRWVTEEIATSDLFQRIARMIAVDAYVAMPGGLGTLGEVALTWNLFQTQSIPRRPFVLVGPAWRAALDCLPGAVRIERRDLGFVRLVDTVDEVVDAIRGRRRRWRIPPARPAQAGPATARPTTPAPIPMGSRRGEKRSSHQRVRAEGLHLAGRTRSPDRRTRRS